MLSIPYIDGTSFNSTGTIYFDASIIVQQKNHFLSSSKGSRQETVAFNIYCKQSFHCIIKKNRLNYDVDDDPYCYDLKIIGKLVNVTDKAEIMMVQGGYFDSFIDIILNNDEGSDYKFDFSTIYKIAIDEITLTNTITKQSVLVDVNEYFNVENDELVEYVGRFDVDDYFNEQDWEAASLFAEEKDVEDEYY